MKWSVRTRCFFRNDVGPIQVIRIVRYKKVETYDCVPTDREFDSNEQFCSVSRVKSKRLLLIDYEQLGFQIYDVPRGTTRLHNGAFQFQAVTTRQPVLLRIWLMK